jgi:hypothetical protein
MNTVTLTMGSLFRQLGLPSNDRAILDFIFTHSPLNQAMPLHRAPMWNQAQTAFLQQSIAEDSEWCVLVDQLDSRLRR